MFILIQTDKMPMIWAYAQPRRMLGLLS